MSAQRILVAEKDVPIASLIETRLSARGYEVVTFTESDAVLRYVGRENVDLMLISSGMERLGGSFVIEKIRERPHLVRIPVILMTDENNIAELVMGQERGFDDFLIKPFHGLVLDLRVAMNIRKTRERIEINALSHLPGNHVIERVIRTKIERGEKYSVLYIDINHFKSFNDLYGFDKGDDVIRQTSKILVRMAESITGDRGYFVGHIGGDDFVVILDPRDEESYAVAFLDEFDRIIATYYNEADQKRGTVRVTNRKGKKESVPLMSCCVAAVNNLHRSYKNLGEISQDAAEVKAFLKTQAGSHYLRDRRSEPLDQAGKALEVLAPPPKARLKSKRRMDPLGQVLLDAGLITREDLSRALKKHFATGQRLGQILISMNAVRSQDVGALLEKKLHVPYVSLNRFFPSPELLRFFTLEFIKSHRIVPLGISGERLKLGMCDPFDLRTLDEIERVASLKPVPYLALEDEFELFVTRAENELARHEKIG